MICCSWAESLNHISGEEVRFLFLFAIALARWAEAAGPLPGATAGDLNGPEARGAAVGAGS